MLRTDRNSLKNINLAMHTILTWASFSNAKYNISICGFEISVYNEVLFSPVIVFFQLCALLTRQKVYILFLTQRK